MWGKTWATPHLNTIVSKGPIHNLYYRIYGPLASPQIFRNPESALAHLSMCGRFGLTANTKEIGRLFSVHNVPEVKPDYNIPPTRGVLGIRASGKEREAHLFHWGLIPSWAKDEEIGYKLINARSETVASKPSFRSAFKTLRLIVPASYYYEWQKEGKEKTRSSSA